MKHKSLDYKIFDFQIIGQSLGGLDIPMVTITNHLTRDRLYKNKRIIFIIGRVHPGETNASHLVHGLIQYLLSPDKISNYLRETYVFHLVPMINPDGVVVGNNRTSFIGRDMNRTYDQPNEQLTPETYRVKELLASLCKMNPGVTTSNFLGEHQKIEALFDLH